MLLPLQGVNAMAIHNPGCRFACPGLGAFGLSARALSAAKPCKKLGKTVKKNGNYQFYRYNLS